MLKEASSQRWDAVIVGSGAGGGPAAWRLSAKGWRVLVLEKGPRIERRDVIPDEVGSCRRDRFVPSIADDPHMLLEGKGGRAHKTYEGWTSCCVGGGTVHMSAMLYRMHEEDFEGRTLYGQPKGSTLIDWPIKYGHMQPYYDEIQEYLQLSGESGANLFGPGKITYPQSPLPTHAMARRIDRVAWAKGLHPYATPRGILTAEHMNRRPCIDCGYCGAYGCPVGAKASTADSFLPAAEQTGKCRILPGAQAVAIQLSSLGEAKAVIAVDDKGNRHKIEADTILLAASAVESARLLLLSQDARHPTGIGNRHGQVGSNLVVSLDSPGRAVFPYPSVEFPKETDHHSFINRSFQDRYIDRDAPGPYPKCGTLIIDRAHRNPIQQGLRALRRDGPTNMPMGPALMERLLISLAEERSIAYECFVEMLPRPGARVRLDSKQTDSVGLPVARIEVDDFPHEVKRVRRLRDLAHDVLGNLSPNLLRMEEDGPLKRTYFLQAGTCRMGSDPASSVVNSFGQVHDVPRLHVIDGACLPTMGGVPPTLTIMANALRIADNLNRVAS
jgi:choline dehydrogenase-like flavoprotein